MSDSSSSVTMPADTANLPPTNPLNTLRDGVNPQVFSAMEAIFSCFDQLFALLENSVMSAQTIQNTIWDGFTNAHFNVTVQMPTNPPSQTQQPPRSVLSAPRMTLQPPVRSQSTTGLMSLSNHSETRQLPGTWQRRRRIRTKHHLGAT